MFEQIQSILNRIIPKEIDNYIVYDVYEEDYNTVLKHIPKEWRFVIVDWDEQNIQHICAFGIINKNKLGNTVFRLIEL